MKRSVTQVTLNVQDNLQELSDTLGPQKQRTKASGLPEENTSLHRTHIPDSGRKLL